MVALPLAVEVAGAETIGPRLSGGKITAPFAPPGKVIGPPGKFEAVEDGV